MKKTLPLLAVCLIQFIFSVTVFAQKFELTPTIQSHASGNKSAAIVKKQSKEAKIGNVISKRNILKSANTSQINYSWGKYFSTSYGDRLYKTVIDASGNVIAVGSKGESSSDVDAVIYKYDTSGNYLWSHTPAISSDIDEIYDVATDRSGNVYITGQFYSSAFDYEIYSNGGSDIFIAKYSPDGTLLWAKNAGGSDYDYGCGIALDGTGNVYVVGFFNGTAYWDGISKTSWSQGNMFIAKYDNNGNAKWVRNGNVGSSSLLTIGVDKTGNTYVGYHFTGSVQFDGGPVVVSSGGTDIFLIKYDTSGNYNWIKTAGGFGDDGSNKTVVCPDGNILIAGYFSDVAQFENKSLTAHGYYDIFAAKYTPSGNLIWVKQFGGTGSQSAWGLCSDEKSNCYLTGWFSGTGAFDNTTIVSSGDEDAYLIKYDKNGNLIWVEPTAIGLDKQVGTDVFVKGNDIAISGYYEGEMYIQGSNFPNYGGEDAYLAKLVQSDIVLPNFIVNPSLTLSTLQFKQGQSITIMGTQFSPVGKVDLQFSGPENLSSILDQSIDVSGTFQYTLSTSSVITLGNYIVTAIDKISGKTYSRTFRIIPEQTTTVDTDLKILEPNISKSRYINEPILFTWQDKIKFNVNTLYNYKHSYSISVQKDNGSWQLVKKVDGVNNGYGDFSLSINYTPDNSGTYKLKVEDNYYPNRSATSPEIIVENTIVDYINVDFIWDKSYPVSANTEKLVGVAADGVARFKMVISNINPLSAEIQKVKVSLSHPDLTEQDKDKYKTPNYLGKLKYCAKQNDNSLTIDYDADDASSILAENYSKNDDGKYWFWYVAPEDFARNQGDWDEKFREIALNFEVTLTDGKKYTKQKNIEIVRPPLLLVHGLNGESDDTWREFRIGAASPKYFDDDRFKIKYAPQMGKTASFDFNSQILLDGIGNNKSFMFWINQLREQGYACNQIDYVCHSMGGSMLRNAAESKQLYYRNSNYKEGFVHKFISLDTPHQGSSLANLLEDISYGGLLTSLITIPGSLKKIAKLYEGFPPKVVDAVGDLKYKNGVKFGILQVPSHLIGGGVSCGNFNAQTLAIYEVLKTYLGTLTFSSFLPQCTWFDLYFNLRGDESDFMDGNDAIVSLTSQFSGYNANLLPSFCTKISGTMHNSIFGLSPTQSSDVFDKVNLLLNSDVSSSEFSYLPSTEVASTKSANNQNEKALTILKNRINILYPFTNGNYNAGDTMNIKLQVDTVGLKNFAIYFQDQSIYTTPSDTLVLVNLTVNPENIEQQSIVIIGNYQINGESASSSATVAVKINPVGSIMEFNVKPEVVVIQKGKSSRPDYEAVFPDAISEIGNSNLITAIIKDPNLLSYDTETNSFTGLATGITNANIAYRGKSKTVFFEILEPVTPIVDPPTGLNDIRMDKKGQLNIKVYPNPVTNELTIEIEGNTKKIDFEIINSLGQSIFTGVVFESTVIQTANFIPGIYLIKLKSGKSFEFKKIIKN